MLEYLKITNVGIPLQNINVSGGKDEYELNTKDINKIKKLYKEDFILWDLLSSKPELFKFVV